MKRNTLLCEVQPACLEMQGLDMHFRYIQNDGVAAVLKAPVEMLDQPLFKKKTRSGGSAAKIFPAGREVDLKISDTG
jgi:hypothetical protein